MTDHAMALMTALNFCFTVCIMVQAIKTQMLKRKFEQAATDLKAARMIVLNHHAISTHSRVGFGETP